MTNSLARHRWPAIAALALVFGLVLIGIHSTAAAAGDTAGGSKVKTVGIVSFAFKPATLKVAKGSQVSFSNTSEVAHTATRNGAFDTGPIKPGRSVTVRFKQKGSFPYHCTIHPSMRGKIVVN